MQIVLLVALSLGLLVLPKDWLGAAYALVWSFTTVLQALLAVWLLRRKIGVIDGARILTSLIRFGVASVPALVLGFAAFVLSRALLPDPGVLLSVLLGAGQAVLVAAAYLVTLKLIRSEELAEVTAFVMRKLGRSRS